MRPSARWLDTILLTGMLTASACASAGSAVPTPISSPAAQPAIASPSPVSSPVTGQRFDPQAQPVVDAAMAEAARHLAANAADLRVELVEPREWSDSSLGCPRQDQMYTQVLTPGYLVIISGGGRRLEYHTDTRGRAVLCRET